MILSAVFPFTYLGEPAELVVVRNNGYCWAEFRTAEGKTYSVGGDRDLYESIDEDAAAEFITAACDATNVYASLASDRVWGAA